MAKRMLDCTASDFSEFTKADYISSIAGSEGRVVACECIGITMPVLSDVTNAEFAAAMGADILLLNMFDVIKPVICGLPKVGQDEVVRELKRLTGRMIGINLEPVEDAIAEGNKGTLWEMSEGRRATLDNALRAYELGVDMVLLTGNPGNGVSNKAITDSLRAMSAELGNKLILAAGKMHASGIIGEGGENIITRDDIKEFVEAGADIILLPAPGTVPGITMEYIRGLVSYAHSLGALTITAIGTSQEGADTETIKQIALMCKMTGTDIHHIGDSGYPGMGAPENIMAYSIAIRGVRHTYHRMAVSINR
ncbi:haloacid dehalogenase-like hydrolase [Kineothrix sedimenti]|uniref:Haloacid dehalogenase-like hydrolase n=1 Tax=Kineothrix sedimenti TaxID=3123317 RepID=A0ABZ3EXT0_9FIRM